MHASDIKMQLIKMLHTSYTEKMADVL